VSAQPIDTNPPDIYGQISDNRLAVQVVIDGLALPAPTLVARPHAVHVTLADVDDLEIDGASLWTLRTETPARRNGSKVAIRVHVPVVSGEDVIACLYPAVTE
jgi:hypothetical protein